MHLGKHLPRKAGVLLHHTAQYRKTIYVKIIPREGKTHIGPGGVGGVACGGGAEFGHGYRRADGAAAVDGLGHLHPDTRAQVRYGSSLTVAEIALGGEAVANITHLQRSRYIGEPGRARRIGGNVCLAAGSLGRTQTAALPLGHAEKLFERQYLALCRIGGIEARRGARQHHHKQHCEQS